MTLRDRPPDGNRNRHSFARLAVFAVMRGAIMMNLPVHRERAIIESLQTVRSDVALSRLQDCV